MKKFFSLILAFCFIFTPMSATAATSNDFLPDSYYEYFSVDYVFYETDNYFVETYLNRNNQPLFTVDDNDMFFDGKLIHSYVGNPEILFFATGDSIYRYHISSKIVDLIISDKDLVWFYPITAHTILYAKGSTNNDGIMCSTETDDTLAYYYYNKLTDTSETTDDPEHSIELTGTPGVFNHIEKNRAQSSYIINFKNIPHLNYPVGSEYTDFFEEVNNIQCQGFALFIYDYLWGSTSYGHRSNSITINDDAIAAKIALENLPAGSHIRVDQGNDDSRHAMILLDTNSTGITVYHANWTGGLVAITDMSYSSFATRYDIINYVQIPDICNHSISYVEYNNNYHTSKCSRCLINYAYGRHYAATTGYGTCLACGYQGYISVGINKVENIIM